MVTPTLQPPDPPYGQGESWPGRLDQVQDQVQEFTLTPGEGSPVSREPQPATRWGESSSTSSSATSSEPTTNSNTQIPWWIKYAIKTVGVAAGIGDYIPILHPSSPPSC